MFILITVPILFPKNSLLYVIGVLYFSVQTWSLASETYGGPILSADSPLIYDDTNQTVRAEKNALLKSDNLLLHAGKIIWDRNQSIVTAEHDVILTARGYRMLCGFIQLDLESGDYMARDVRLGFHPWIFTAKELQKRNNSVQGSAIAFQTGKRSDHSWRPQISFQEASFENNESKLTTGSGRILIGTLPILPIPPLSLDTKIPKESLKISAKAGKKANLGWYLGKAASWEVAEITTDTEITAFFDRGALLSTGLSYQNDGLEYESPWVQAKLDGGWIKDQGDHLGLDRRSLPFSDNRHYLDLEFIVHHRTSWRLAALMNLESDSEINRDFRIEKFSQSQWNDHFFEIGYESDWGGISGIHRFQANEHESLVERKPNIRFEVSPLQISAVPIYHSAVIEYADLSSRNSMGQYTEGVTKLDSSIYNFYPLQISNGLSYIPSLTVRNQLYDTGLAEPRVTWSEWANVLKLQLYGDYDWNDKLWEINGIRHFMEFSLVHQKVELSSEKNRSHIPAIDHSFYNLNLEPMSLIDQTDADQLNEIDKIRLNWTHRLSTIGERGNKDLARVTLSQDLWTKMEQPLYSDKSFYSKIELHPARWFRLEAQIKKSGLDSQNMSVISAIVEDGYLNQYQLSKINFPNSTNQWAISGSKHIDFDKNLFISLLYDQQTQNFPFWLTTLELNTENDLTYTFSLSQRKGSLKEDELSFSFGFRLLSF